MTTSEIHIPDTTIYKEFNSVETGETQENFKKIIESKIVYPYNIEVESIGGLGENVGLKNIDGKLKNEEFINSGLKDFEITYLLELNGKGIKIETEEDVDNLTMLDIDEIFNDLFHSGGVNGKKLGILRGNCEGNLSFSNKIKFLQKCKYLYSKKEIEVTKINYRAIKNNFSKFKINRLSEELFFIQELYKELLNSEGENFEHLKKIYTGKINIIKQIIKDHIILNEGFNLYENYKDLNTLEEKNGIVSKKYTELKYEIEKKFTYIEDLIDKKDIQSMTRFMNIGSILKKTITEAKLLLFILKLNRTTQIKKLNKFENIDINNSEDLTPPIIREILEQVNKIKIDLITMINGSKLNFKLKEKYIYYVIKHFQKKYSIFLKISTKIHDYKASKLDEAIYFENLNDLFNFKESFLIKFYSILKENNDRENKNKKNVSTLKEIN